MEGQAEVWRQSRGRGASSSAWISYQRTLLGIVLIVRTEDI